MTGEKVLIILISYCVINYNAWRKTKKPDKLSHVEISRRSRNKRKQEDPEDLRKRENTKNKRHYNKKKMLILNSKTRKTP